MYLVQVLTLLFTVLSECLPSNDEARIIFRPKSVEFVKRSSCPVGFIVEQDGQCIDVDECRHPNICNGLRCQNTPGSYSCEEHYLSDEPKCKAGERIKKGWLADSCEDIDECEETPNICGERECENTKGSYKCGKIKVKKDSCAPGQKEGLFGCRDINECEENPKICGEQECENTPGSYKCVSKSSTVSSASVLPQTAQNVSSMKECKAGYKMENGLCVDVDECSERLNACPIRLDCENTPGSYKCTDPLPKVPPIAVPPYSRPMTCQAGYRKDGGGCRDIDECSEGRGPCRRDQQCRNTQGSFECKCPFGTEEKNGVCQYVDPCNPNPCSHRCAVAGRSYTCSCSIGMRLALNKRTCLDINECIENTHLCSHECTNTHGSYTCSCPAGYELTDRTLCKVKLMVSKFSSNIQSFDQRRKNNVELTVFHQKGTPTKINVTFALSLMLDGSFNATNSN